MDVDKADSTQFWFRVASTIGAALTAAFLAWAGVVWTGWQDVSDKIFGMSNDVAEMRVEVRHMTETVRLHAAKPWHDRAGEILIELQTQQKTND